MGRVAGIVGVLVGVISMSAAPSQAAGSNVLLGSFNGSNTMQAWQGKNDAVDLIYIGWSDSVASVQSQLLTAWNTHRSVPVVSWYLLNSANGNALIASGSQDGHLLPYVTMFKQFLAGPDGTYGNADDRRIYLRPDWEANGTWYGFSPAYGDPGANAYQVNVSTFKAMWQHLHSLFSAAGMGSPDLMWMFSVSSHDAYYKNSSHIAEDIYPGDSVVDWIGLDGHNKGTPSADGWETPDQLFDDMVGRMAAIAPSKPIGISEVSSTTNGSTVSAKAAWITSYFTWLRGAVGQAIRMTVWFNQDKTEDGVFRDFAVFGGANGDSTYATFNAYSEYASAVSTDAWLTASDTSNPRLISDPAFLGTG
jgi:hypothetical protein